MAPIPNANPEGMHIYKLNERPERRVIEIPILPDRRSLSVIESRGTIQNIETVQLQAMQFGLDIGNTAVLWWGWAPVREAMKPEVRRGLNRTKAMAGSAKFAMQYFRAWVEPMDRYGGAASDLCGWLDTLIEDCEQNLGMP